MKDPNQNRPGYKETKVGWIPKEWKCLPLGELFTERNSKGKPGLKTYSVTVDNGLVPRDTLERKMAPDLPPEESLYVENGDIAYNMMRMWQGSVAVAEQRCVVSPAYVVCRPNATANSEFYLCYFKSHIGLYQLWAYSYGITGDRLRLYYPDFAKTPAPHPPLPEQKKIAEILSTCDDAIDRVRDLIAAKKRQKTALMQQLLTGKMRLPGFKGEWSNLPLSSMMKESRIAGSSGSLARKITIKLYGKGLLPKVEKRTGSDATQYFARRTGQFIYSKLDFLNGAFGIVPPELDGFESTLDLPAFDLKQKINSCWLLAYLGRESFYRACFHLANGGRKARRINPKDFKHIFVLTPCLDEQAAIAQVLSTADAGIAVLEQKLAVLQQQKKGLMQKLLTGQIRVKP